MHTVLVFFIISFKLCVIELQFLILTYFEITKINLLFELSNKKNHQLDIAFIKDHSITLVYELFISYI